MTAEREPARVAGYASLYTDDGYGYRTPHTMTPGVLTEPLLVPLRVGRQVVGTAAVTQDGGGKLWIDGTVTDGEFAKRLGPDDLQISLVAQLRAVPADEDVFVDE